MTDIAAYYDNLSDKYPNGSSAALDGSDRSLQKRYQVLTQGIESGQSVLDVGCNYGPIGMYLNDALNLGVDYTGIDISKKAIEIGKKINPIELNLIHTSLQEFDPVDLLTGKTKQYDWVIAQGLFYLLPDTEDGRKEVLKIITLMLRLGRSVRFCALSSWGENTDNELLIDPVGVLNWLRMFSKNITFDHSYLPHDCCFTIGREDY